MRVDEAVRRYSERLERNQPGSFRAWGTYLRKMSAELGTVDLDDVSTDQLEDMLTKFRTEAVRRANGTEGFGAQETGRQAVRGLYRWARAGQHTLARPDEDPRIAKERRPEVERRAYVRRELEEISGAVDGLADAQLGRLVLRLVLETGGRREGLLGLEWQDRHARDGVLTLTPKGYRGKRHRAPVTAKLWDAIDGFVQERVEKPKATTRLLVNRRGEPITRRWFENAAANIRRQVPDLAQAGSDSWFTWHGLRHTAATEIRRVAGDAVAGKFLGHSPAGRSVTERYVKATTEEVRAAMVKVWAEPMAGRGHGYGVGEWFPSELDAEDWTSSLGD